MSTAHRSPYTRRVTEARPAVASASVDISPRAGTPVTAPVVTPALDDETTRRFWGDAEPAPAAPGRRRRSRRRGRQAEHVLRHISPWGVLKVSVLLSICLWIVLLMASVILWTVGRDAGLLGNLESFWAEATGKDSVSWDGEVLFRSASMAGGVLAVAGVGFAVLFAVLFNLICDLTGGIRLTVIELEPRPVAKRSRGRRRRRS